MKLFDYFAAGRPIVTTPRTATAERVIRHGAGLVTRGDEPDDLAATIGRVLGDRGPCPATGRRRTCTPPYQPTIGASSDAISRTT